MRGLGPWMLAIIAIGFLLVAADGKVSPNRMGPLVCENPPHWQLDGKDLMKEHKGNVVIVALLKANCHLCLWQAAQLRLMLAEYNKTGMTELRAFVVNDHPSIRVAHYLQRRAYPIPMYQDRPGSDVWEKLQGGKDDIYIYDRCGRLAYYIPNPISFLYKPYVAASILSTYYEEPCGPCPPSTEEVSAINNCTNMTDEANSINTDFQNPNLTLQKNTSSETNISRSSPTTSNHSSIKDFNVTDNSTNNPLGVSRAAITSDVKVDDSNATTESSPHVRTPDHRHGGHMKHYPKSFQHQSNNETSGENHRDENRPYQHTTAILANDINRTDSNSPAAPIATSSKNTTGHDRKQIGSNSTEPFDIDEDSENNNSTARNSTKPPQNNGTTIDTIISEVDNNSTDIDSENKTVSINQCKMPYNISVTAGHTVRLTYDKFYPNYEKILNVALENWLQRLVAPSGITSTPKPIPRANSTPKISDRGRSTIPWRIRQHRHGQHAVRGEEAASSVL